MMSCLPGKTRSVAPTRQKIHGEGAVVTRIDNLLTDEEANRLVEMARWRYKRSRTGALERGGVNAWRTSSTAYLPMNDPFVKCIAKRLATVAGAPQENLENLQVVRYRSGERYRPHYDYLWERPERLMTLFVYLQDDGMRDGTCGGATAFPRLNTNGRPLRVFPKQGSALLWSNWWVCGVQKTCCDGLDMNCAHAMKN